MKQTLTHRVRSLAFTLVELIIVIGIIAVLAAMIFPAFSAVKKRNYILKAKTELKQVEVAIGSYKARNGYFPPGNRLAASQPAAQRQLFALNPLFFELRGSKLTGNNYETLDSRLTLAAADVSTAFGGGVTGFMNCTRGGGDDSAPAQDFLKELKPGQFVIGTYKGKPVALLTCTVQWARDLPPVLADFTPSEVGVYPNPWRYNSLNPTNNPGQYDLWVDLIISGKTNRISNWSSKPEVIYEP